MDLCDDHDEARQRVDSLLFELQGQAELHCQNKLLVAELGQCRARLQEFEASQVKTQSEVTRLTKEASLVVEQRLHVVEERDRTLTLYGA